MGDGPGGGGAAVDEFEGNGMGVQEWLELMLDQDGGIEEAIRCARVNEGVNGDRWLAWDQKGDQERRMTR